MPCKCPLGCPSASRQQCQVGCQLPHGSALLVLQLNNHIWRRILSSTEAVNILAAVPCPPLLQPWPSSLPCPTYPSQVPLSWHRMAAEREHNAIISWLSEREQVSLQLPVLARDNKANSNLHSFLQKMDIIAFKPQLPTQFATYHVPSNGISFKRNRLDILGRNESGFLHQAAREPVQRIYRDPIHSLL